MTTDKAYSFFEARQKERGIDLEFVWTHLKDLKVETPSWGYGDSGTRFKVFRQVGIPRDVFEKMDDAALVNKLTGICPTVAIHIPWDKTSDYVRLRTYTESLGLKIGAVNPNLFQEDDYMFGSICNSNESIRKKALNHMLECLDIMRLTGSKVFTPWIPDGTNYPGQADIRKRKRWLTEIFSEIYSRLDKDMRLLIEYKFFEPHFYHTDVMDWGLAYSLCLKLGEQAQVLVDTGHHAPGTNVEQIVAILLDECRLGGFHFNSRKYSDDDLIVGSINPYELFLIFYQIISAKIDTTSAKIRRNADEIAFMIDQSHNIEPKIPAMIRSVLNVQTQYAKALLINWEKLQNAQIKNDVLAAEAEVREAFEQDATPLLHAYREQQKLPVDPMQAYLKSGYAEKIRERGIGGASW